MKPFRFRAQRVLALRQQTQAHEQRQLGRAIVNLLRAERVLQDLERDRRTWGHDTRDRRRQGQTVAEWARDWWRLQALERARQEAGAALWQAREALISQRRRLEAARVRARSLARLRERQWAEHVQAVQRHEQAELDEWAARRLGVSAL